MQSRVSSTDSVVWVRYATCPIGHHQLVHVSPRAIRNMRSAPTHGAHHLVVTGAADQMMVYPRARSDGFVMDLGDERARGVDHPQPAPVGPPPDRGEMPWALKITVSSGTSSARHEVGALARSASTTCRLCTISLRTHTGGGHT